jgi:hypothetical protein
LGFDRKEVTPHGFRATACTLLNEMGWRSEAIERRMAHGVSDSVRRHYNYAQHLPERRILMQAWADYLDGLRSAQDDVAQIHCGTVPVTPRTALFTAEDPLTRAALSMTSCQEPSLRRNLMTRICRNLLLLALALGHLPATLASTTRYVDGVSGSDASNCASPTAACKTIGHAIAQSAAGDAIMVAAATYTENLTVAISLEIIGAGSANTVIDGGGRASVIDISATSAHVRLSGVTLTHGDAGWGGGIYNVGTLTLVGSSVTGNHAFQGGGVDGSATLHNVIVANNTGGNCAGTMSSQGYNLSSDGSCNYFRGPGDLNSIDPKLGTLGNCGGPTQTIPLLSGSPAIDSGNPSGCTDALGKLLTTDERGMPRPDREDAGACDWGAYESQSD